MSKALDITIWEKFARGWQAQHTSSVEDVLPPLTNTNIQDARSVVFGDDDDDDDI